MLKSKEKDKDKEKKESRERQLSNHLIVSKMEYICIINNDALYPPFYLSFSLLTALCD